MKKGGNRGGRVKKERTRGGIGPNKTQNSPTGAPSETKKKEKKRISGVEEQTALEKKKKNNGSVQWRCAAHGQADWWTALNSFGMPEKGGNNLGNLQAQEGQKKERGDERYWGGSRWVRLFGHRLSREWLRG